MIDCAPGAEPVYVDRDMWEKIVLNLVSNAFKFTLEGEIAVTVRPAPGAVEVAVRDTGIGIPSGEISRLFERFHRVEGARGRTHEGTGIGLALVHELFPILAERQNQLAGTMSGGQQRMVSLGLALMSGPKLLLLDEPSLGLAPRLVADIFERVRVLADREGLSVVLLEQNVGAALRIVDRVYVMRSGRVILEETAEQMRQRESFWDLF